MRSKLVDIIVRSWYYFRTGYGTYLTFMLGAVNTLVVVWYLAIKDVPAVENLFGSHFLTFAIVISLVGIPLSIAIGLLHFKKTPAYHAEQDISVESNPYNYKLAQGWSREVMGPLWLETISILKKIGNAQGVVSSEEMNEIAELERKIRILCGGGFVGFKRETKE